MKNILIIAVLFILPFSLRSQDDTLPERIVENVSNGIIVTYKFPKPIIQPNSLIQETYFLRFNGFGINEVPGEPAVPFRSDLFYIPTGYNTRVDIIEQTYIDTFLVLSPSNFIFRI